jgi:hypothetical protein
MEKGSDVTFLREIIGFAAQRLRARRVRGQHCCRAEGGSRGGTRNSPADCR